MVRIIQLTSGLLTSFFANLYIPLLSALWTRLAARILKVNLAEAEKPLASYKRLIDLFTRELKNGVRPIGNGAVSPTDAVLRDFGRYQEGVISQPIKGCHYSVIELTGCRQAPLEGYYFNFYLSPKDYHHVHLPLDAVLMGIRVIPGWLWPVNNWALAKIANLFIKNRRVVFEFKNQQGSFSLVMVGALNVGQVRLELPNSKEVIDFSIPSYLTCEQNLQKGVKIASFELGSSVVLIFDKTWNISSSQTLCSEMEIKMGETLFG